MGGGGGGGACFYECRHIVYNLYQLRAMHVLALYHVITV